MTPTQAQLEALGDPALAVLARTDNTDAFAELWRRHAGAGLMAARQFAGIADPQDIVSEAYLRILRAMQKGGGPHEAFRPYLYRTIRNIALDWRSRLNPVPLDETDELPEANPSLETTVLENAVTAQAFEQLPERWQAVLWYLEVEGMSPTEAAPMLGLSPNATSVLAGRAHEGFKKAWLQAHVNDRSVPAECQWTTERMGGYVRHGLTRRARVRFDRHLDECERCALLAHEIGDLGGQLASVLLPVALGSVAGSLLLGQLRDHAASSMVATIAPIVAPASAVLRGAAVAVLATGALLAPASVEQAPRPPATADGGHGQGAPSTDAEAGPLTTVIDQPIPGETPAEPVSAPVVEPEPVATAQPQASTPSTAPASMSDPALVDLSLSLLSGAVTVDAEVDLDPVTDLLEAVAPGLPLPGLSLPGISLLGG